MEKNIEISLLLDFYGELLKPNGRRAAELYYNDDLSLAEVAGETGMTRQGARDHIKRAEQQLYDYERKLGLLKRFGQLEAGLEKIAEQARLIAARTDNDNIRLPAREILRLTGELTEKE